MRLLVIIAALIPFTLRAEVSRSLGKSPNGSFELFLVTESAEDLGMVVVKNLKSGKTAETETSQGYGTFENSDVEATWKSTSDAFAVEVRGTKRTRNTDVYILNGDAWEKLAFPPYVANILGRQGVFKGGRNLYEEFGEFEGESRFVILCHIEPDWQQQEKALHIKDWKPTTQTEWKVVLEYARLVSPNCSIVSIEPDDSGAENLQKSNR
jgi:hypothetical protein